MALIPSLPYDNVEGRIARARLLPLRDWIFSNRLKPSCRNLTDRADVVGEGDPDHVEFRRIRVTPHVFARTHDDLSDAVGEEMLRWFGGQRRRATSADKHYSPSLDHFFFLHGLMFKP